MSLIGGGICVTSIPILR